MSPTELASALSAAITLIETSPGAIKTSNIEVLRSRLKAHYSHIGTLGALADLDLLRTTEELEFQTAQEALKSIRRIQDIVDTPVDDSLQEPPPLGTRDLARIRTLLSLVFKWGVEKLHLQVCQGLPAKLSSAKDQYKMLCDNMSTILALVFPEGVIGRISQTLITTTLLSMHVPGMLLPALTLGWLPEKLASEDTPVMHGFRPLVMRLMKLLSSAQTISGLGVIISSTNPPPPVYVHKACTTLLTKQLLRPDGLIGLFMTMFPEDESNGDEIQLDKFEQVSKIVNSIPAGMKAEEYLQTILPRVLEILLKSTNTSHKRAAAFIFYRALVPEKLSSSNDLSKIALSILQSPFLRETQTSLLDPHRPHTLKPREALDVIVSLLANTEPSPYLISTLLSPLIPALYGLSLDISNHKTVDPHLKELVIGLLKSWGKIIESTEGEDIIWEVIEGQKTWDWKFDLEGNIFKVLSEEKRVEEILMPKHSEDHMLGDIDINLFNLYPDPVHFVEILKSFDRGDITSSIFVKLLEWYRYKKSLPDGDSINVLHKLQIIMQMQKRLSEGTTTNILRKPDKLLPFILHVLSTVDVMGANKDESKYTGPEDEEDSLGDTDSDDEDAGPQVLGPDDDLIETTVTLLLSILEADETLSVAAHPILNDIFSLLEPISTKAGDTLRPLAREARLVMTARLAQTSGTTKPKSKEDDDVQEIYQRALKLLQDPILPVRAHGLLLLRQLLGSAHAKNPINQALMPSILSIFLQSVQDEDSYIFLNAVQGLTLLVDRFGKDILKALVRDYVDKLGGLGAGSLTQQDIDVRTRIGEALAAAIKKCGNVLSIYIDMIIPPLFAIVRNRDVPTVLRTSSLSILGDCLDTYPPAVWPYVEDLTSGMLDLLQLESVPATEVVKSKQRDSEPRDDPEDSISAAPAHEDSEPKSTNSKFPLLRRSAIHFISLLIKASTEMIYDSSSSGQSFVFPPTAVKKANITLRYIASTDQDSHVRAMAREATDNLELLQKAVLGL